MKCEGNDVPLSQRNFLDRGAQGDELCFPQVAELIPPPIPIYEVQAAIQARVQALRWSLEQVRQFLGVHFEGLSHIWELQAHELTTYLYYLRVEGLSHG